MMEIKVCFILAFGFYVMLI